MQTKPITKMSVEELKEWPQEGESLTIDINHFGFYGGASEKKVAYRYHHYWLQNGIDIDPESCLSRRDLFEQALKRYVTDEVTKALKLQAEDAAKKGGESNDELRKPAGEANPL